MYFQLYLYVYHYQIHLQILKNGLQQNDYSHILKEETFLHD